MSLSKHRILSDACRDCRKTLLLYRNKLSGNPLNMNNCFDHALACSNCCNWATRNGFHELLKKYADDKMKQMHCPVCYKPMKVSFDFQVAKCLQCGFELCWQDPMRMAMSILNLTRILAKRRGVELREKETSVADVIFSGLDEL